jgi:hypothetical protein
MTAITTTVLLQIHCFWTMEIKEELDTVPPLILSYLPLLRILQSVSWHLFLSLLILKAHFLSLSDNSFFHCCLGVFCPTSNEIV